MNPEQRSPDQVLGIVQHAIHKKAWYAYNPQDHSYNWPASVAAISQMLEHELSWHVPTDVVRDIIEASFTRDSLARVHDDEGRDAGIFIARIAALAEDHHAPLYIWTEGDVGFQWAKYQRTGTDEWVDGARFMAAATNKIGLLEGIIRSMRAGIDPDTMFHVYVVDDKDDNLHALAGVQTGFNGQPVQIHDYYINLNDPQADPTQCLKTITEKVQAHSMQGARVGLVFDFDGTLIDSDGTMYHVAAKKLTQAFFAGSHQSHQDVAASYGITTTA